MSTDQSTYGIGGRSGGLGNNLFESDSIEVDVGLLASEFVTSKALGKRLLEDLEQSRWKIPFWQWQAWRRQQEQRGRRCWWRGRTRNEEERRKMPFEEPSIQLMHWKRRKREKEGIGKRAWRARKSPWERRRRWYRQELENGNEFEENTNRSRRSRLLVDIVKEAAWVGLGHKVLQIGLVSKRWTEMERGNTPEQRDYCTSRRSREWKWWIESAYSRGGSSPAVLAEEDSGLLISAQLEIETQN